MISIRCYYLVSFYLDPKYLHNFPHKIFRVDYLFCGQAMILKQQQQHVASQETLNTVGQNR